MIRNVHLILEFVGYDSIRQELDVKRIAHEQVVDPFIIRGRRCKACGRHCVAVPVCLGNEVFNVLESAWGSQSLVSLLGRLNVQVAAQQHRCGLRRVEALSFHSSAILINFALSFRATVPIWSKCVHMKTNGTPVVRCLNWATVTMRGKAASHPVEPTTSGSR